MNTTYSLTIDYDYKDAVKIMYDNINTFKTHFGKTLTFLGPYLFLSLTKY